METNPLISKCPYVVALDWNPPWTREYEERFSKVEEWWKKYPKGYRERLGMTFYFSNKEDAILFKLTWG